MNTSGSNDNGEETVYNSWQATLRTYGNEHSLSKQCESLIRATEEVTKTQSNYVDGVAAENVAVDNCVNIEKVVLDEVQKLEEVSLRCVYHVFTFICSYHMLTFVCSYHMLNSHPPFVSQFRNVSYS